MRIVKRISKMYVVAELPRWNPETKEYDLYPGDLKVVPDETHPDYHHMWGWDRMDRRKWYWKYGGLFDEYVKRWHKPRKK